MSQRWPYLAVLALLLFVPACRKPVPQQPVVVHLFRDLYSPYAYQLDHRILDFQSTNPRLPSGLPIVVQTFHEIDYKTALKGNFGKNVQVEVVILNSGADAGDNPALVGGLAHAVDICAAVKACPANVPAFVVPGVTGDRTAAAQAFIDFLAQHK